MASKIYSADEIAHFKREYARCSAGYAGFVYWCKHYVKVPDKRSGRPVPMILYPAQKTVAREIIENGNWLWILKARQLGMTWCFAAIIMWFITFKNLWTASVMNQTLYYARQFIDKIYFIWSHLPQPHLQAMITSKNKDEMVFDHMGKGCAIYSVAASENAARSMTNNMNLYDEAGYFEYLKESLQASEPAVERSGGVNVGMSTSNGPHGDFYDGWKSAIAGESRYKPLFFEWWQNPERTQDWYNNEAAHHVNEPLYMAREFPSSPEEAWTAAGGRCFPFFSAKTHERSLYDMGYTQAHRDWARYRCIDWGGDDPFVCLFVMLLPHGKGITVDKKCVNTMRELSAYHRDPETGDPVDDDNHIPDALRYLVMTVPLKGHIHVYDEIYIPHAAEKKLDLIHLINKVKERSGDDRFHLSVADRSNSINIVTFTAYGVPLIPAKTVRRGHGKFVEINAGIDMLNIYVNGVNELHLKKMEPSAADQIRKKYEDAGLSATNRIPDRWHKVIQKRLDRKKCETVPHPVLGEDY
jgi:hypothetical protein